MAVVDKYTFDEIKTNDLFPSAYKSGGESKGIIAPVKIAADNDDGSVFRIAADISGFLVPRIIGINSAITLAAGATEFDLGLYKKKNKDGSGGEVISVDCFADGIDLQSAVSSITSGVDWMQSVALADRHKRIFEHAGHSFSTNDILSSYDIGLTANTIGDVAGIIVFFIDFVAT